MKKFLLTGLCLCMALLGFAQGKPTLGVENFSGSIPENALNHLRKNVMNGALQSNRVVVVDVNDMGTAGNYDAFLRCTVDGVRLKPAEIIDGKGNKRPGMQCYMDYTLSVINAANGQVIRQESFTAYGEGHREGDAVNSCVSWSENKPVKNFFLNAFPLGGTIVAVDEADAKKVKSVYIDLGSDAGVVKGQKLEVFKVIDIAGATSTKQIGELKIEEVMGGNRSLCKVTKNGEGILVEINNGTPLVVETKEAKTNFLGF